MTNPAGHWPAIANGGSTRPEVRDGDVPPLSMWATAQRDSLSVLDCGPTPGGLSRDGTLPPASSESLVPGRRPRRRRAAHEREIHHIAPFSPVRIT